MSGIKQYREELIKNPICGNCGKPLRTHWQNPHNIYCYEHTNGDIFTDEPNEEWTIEQALEKYLELYPTAWKDIISNWKKENGHA